VRIARVKIEAWDVELTEPFGIASGAQVVAKNVLLELELGSGHTGLGEAAPFPAVNGETQADALAALEAVATDLLGYEGADAQQLPPEARERLEATPSALAAVEMALLDAACRARGISLFEHFGGRQPRLLTDITIPTGGAQAAADAARRALVQDFRTLKVKVGGQARAHALCGARSGRAPSALANCIAGGRW
jgi:L-alanine-DL-glutamate epimerase-like enolase superfamily enzyme